MKYYWYNRTDIVLYMAAIIAWFNVVHNEETNSSIENCWEAIVSTKVSMCGSCAHLAESCWQKQLYNDWKRLVSKLFLTHWGWVTHICVSNLTIIGSDKGLLPGRRQAIFWTNAGILLIGPMGTNFSEILIQIRIFSFKKMHFKLSSAKWHSFCLGLNLLNKLHFLILL